MEAEGSRSRGCEFRYNRINLGTQTNNNTMIHSKKKIKRLQKSIHSDIFWEKAYLEIKSSYSVDFKIIVFDILISAKNIPCVNHTRSFLIKL